MGRARGANAIMGLAFESAYGTPPVSGYKLMPFVSSQLGATQGMIESDLLGLGRAPADPTYDVVMNDGDVVVPLDTRSLGHWLRLLLGAPATSSAREGFFNHVFKSGLPALPSASIEIGLPDRPTYSTHYGVRANTFQVQMQRSGLASATIGLIGKGETVPALTSNAGALTSLPAAVRFPQARGSIMADGQTLGEIVSANFSFSNALEKDETIRPDGEINDVDPGMPSASIQLTSKFADVSLMNKATSKTPVAIELTWGIDNDTYLVLGMDRVFLPRTKRPITGPGGIQLDLNGMASQPEGGSLFRASLGNDVSAYI